MEYMQEVNPGEILIFRWKGGSTVEIGRPQTERLDGDIPEEDRGYVWDKSFKVYDKETGKVTIFAEYAAFKAKCLEWVEEQKEADSA
ncbi:hypothetical protein OG306_33110 [Streptomyces sp. NBC_01241]|uniref:hypothetical protein n=1 Tax=Streptomyces sp. NBC_01241 TaxID=2903794 RepID=UPI00352D3792|nr:hypothetical protein OG306_33110 [Streptomyces sp. NBC_01241]